MRVLIVTDSLGMARPDVPLEQVWSHRLSKLLWESGHEAVVMSYRGLTSRRLLEEPCDELGDIHADAAIFQVGIVDCCRRPYSNGVRKVVERIGLVRKVVTKFRLPITKAIGRPVIPPGEFAANLRSAIGKANANGTAPAVLHIAPPGAFLRERIHKVAEDVAAYNAIIDRLGDVTVLRPYQGAEPEALTLDADGHHLTQMGHQLVLESALAFLAGRGLHLKS
jgi:lysophospholipase L1-like esterase